MISGRAMLQRVARSIIGGVLFNMCPRLGSLLLLAGLVVWLGAGCGTPGLRARHKSHTASTELSDSALGQLAQAHALFAAGVIEELNGNQTGAVQAYYEAGLKDPLDEQLILDVTAHLIQAKELEKALSVAKNAADRSTVSASVLARLGFIYAQMGKDELALAANRKAIRRSPDVLLPYHNLFLHYVQKKQPELALKTLAEAEAQVKPESESFLAISELYAGFGLAFPAQREQTAAKALELLRRVDKLAPADPSIRLKLADGMNLLGDAERASQLYLELLKKLPDVPLARERVHAKLAEIYLRTKDRSKALEQLQALIHEDPLNAQAYYYLGRISFDEGKVEEAIDHYRKTIILNGNFEPAYYELASALISVHKTHDALTLLEEARQKFAENFFCEFLTGMALGMEKSYGEAIRHFTAAEVIASAKEPDRLNENFFFQVGATHERNGDYRAAETYFLKSLRLAPNNAEVMNYLGYMWTEQGTKLVEARELIEKALKQEPENEAFLDSMGWVLFRLNKPAEALPYLEKALKVLKEPDSVVYDHLGDVHAALNQMEEAREYWSKSLAIEASDAVRKKLDAGAPQRLRP
jgi:tetratricopeptide (TPR) repeat protein